MRDETLHELIESATAIVQAFLEYGEEWKDQDREVLQDACAFLSEQYRKGMKRRGQPE